MLDSKTARMTVVSGPQSDAVQRKETAETLQVGTDPRFVGTACAVPPQASVTPTINSTRSSSTAPATTIAATEATTAYGEIIPRSSSATIASSLTGPQRTALSVQPQRASFHGSVAGLGYGMGTSVGAPVSHRHSVAIGGEQENRRPLTGSVRRTGKSSRAVFRCN